MMSADASAKMEADVRVHPLRSQVVLVSFVGGAVIVAIAGAVLFGMDNMIGGGVLVGLSTLLGGCAIVGWMKAQPATDNPDPAPTSVQLPGGLAVSVDGRFIADQANAATFFQFVNGLLYQQRLPAASGVLDENHEVVPDSEVRAKEITEQLNDETEAAIADAMDRMRAHEAAASVEQVPQADPGGPDVPMPPGLNVAGG